MKTHALFTKVNDRWRFEGFEESTAMVINFMNEVEQEIRDTKESPVPTQEYRIVSLD